MLLWEKSSVRNFFSLSKPPNYTSNYKSYQLILLFFSSYWNVQISDAATKEYNLEKSMQMMVEEWSDMEFSIEPYGETGTYTLSSVDSIQVWVKARVSAEIENRVAKIRLSKRSWLMKIGNLCHLLRANLINIFSSICTDFYISINIIQFLQIALWFMNNLPTTACDGEI